ncbi:MAG: MBL fold metallo-hydrolase [Cyclobacteriaceae bacterium]|nr:MBL fold metallo-hydrolase [Cyclobacteriaceae bacterium]MCH8516343.1 MBL fold metallo-hydrolase [Cyclobacteriaceae bacterium]
MKVEQIYTGCLAQGAYYIESNGEVAIVDPLRETAPYIEKAKADGAKIKYVLETHFHADFVSGHVDLAEKTGAKIVFGPNAKIENYDAHIATDGEILELGNVKIKVLHTPGHTMESTTYLLLDDNGKEHSIYSGDTLFIGDVGRPDLAVKSDLTQDDLAAHLFDSLRNKIMTLPDDVIVYPGHGAGSACGKNMSKETTDSLGNQKANNYALRADMTKEEFIKEVTAGLTAPPQYFGANVAMNKSGYQSFDKVKEQGLVGLTPDQLEAVVSAEGALVLDTRHQDEFKKGFIPQSIFIGLDGQFAPWVGALITDIHQPIVVVTEEGLEEEAITRLARVGYDNSLGYLKGGFAAWKASGKEVDSVEQVSAEELASKMAGGDVRVVDVRKPSEYLSHRLESAVNAPLDFINEHLEKFDKEATNFVHCAGGYRSMIAMSILKARGYHNLVDVAGGFKALEATEAKKTDYVCPSTIDA